MGSISKKLRLRLIASFAASTSITDFADAISLSIFLKKTINIVTSAIVSMVLLLQKQLTVAVSHFYSIW